MSYLVLARKWRPRNFEEVVGQSHVAATLENALKTGRLSHAFLFSGVRGVGKTSVARILAKAINCQDGPTPSPCNNCENCTRITNGSSVDVLEIDGASNRGINEIRELRENIHYSPAHSRNRIYIIDEVHMLTTEAFNALLKTLEEPPGHVTFIFATTEAHKVPVTILSRCQRYEFKRIGQSELKKYLLEITHKESVQIESMALSMIAREADGSMRDALSLLEHVLIFGGSEITAENVRDILGILDRTAVFQIFEAIVNRDVFTCIKRLSALYEHGVDLRRLLRQLAENIRNLLLAHHADNLNEIIDVSGDEINDLKILSKKIEADTLHNLFNILVSSEWQMRKSPNPRLILEMTLARMASYEPVTGIIPLLDRLEKLEHRILAGNPSLMSSGSKGLIDTAMPEDIIQPVPPVIRGSSPLSGNDISAENFINFLKQKKDYSCLSRRIDGNNILFKDNEVILDILPGSLQYDWFHDRENKELMEKAVIEFSGRGIKLTYRDKNGQVKIRKQTDNYLNIRKKAESHPMVQEAISIFDANIIDVKTIEE